MKSRVKSIISSAKTYLNNNYETITKYTGVVVLLALTSHSLYLYSYKSFDIDTLAVTLAFNLIIAIFLFTAFYKPRIGIIMIIPPIYFVMITIIIVYNPETFTSLGAALVGSLFVYGVGKIVMNLQIREEDTE